MKHQHILGIAQVNVFLKGSFFNEMTFHEYGIRNAVLFETWFKQLANCKAMKIFYIEFAFCDESCVSGVVVMWKGALKRIINHNDIHNRVSSAE